MKADLGLNTGPEIERFCEEHWARVWLTSPVETSTLLEEKSNTAFLLRKTGAVEDRALLYALASSTGDGVPRECWQKLKSEKPIHKSPYTCSNAI